MCAAQDHFISLMVIIFMTFDCPSLLGCDVEHTSFYFGLCYRKFVFVLSIKYTIMYIAV